MPDMKNLKENCNGLDLSCFGWIVSISGAFLWLAQRQIPIGTAYAVWTGIGAAGTFLVGIHFYGDPTSLMRYLGVALIILGVITLKLSS